MLPFVAPTVRGTFASVSFCYFTAATPKRLVFRPDLCSPLRSAAADPLYFGAVVVVRYQAASVVVLDVDVVFVAANTVQLRWGCEDIEKGTERAKGVL